MACRVCGKDTDNDTLCKECKNKVNVLSGEYLSDKRKINLQFDEHRFYTRDKS